MPKKGEPLRKLTEADVLLLLRSAEGMNGSIYRRAMILGPIFGVHGNYAYQLLTGFAWPQVTRKFIEESELLKKALEKKLLPKV